MSVHPIVHVLDIRCRTDLLARHHDGNIDRHDGRRGAGLKAAQFGDRHLGTTVGPR